jgi:hypothetical protein
MRCRVTLVAGRIPFMTILTDRFALEDFLAEFELAGLFRGRRILSGSRTTREKGERQQRCRGDFEAASKRFVNQEIYPTSRH